MRKFFSSHFYRLHTIIQRTIDERVVSTEFALDFYPRQ